MRRVWRSGMLRGGTGWSAAARRNSTHVGRWSESRGSAGEGSAGMCELELELALSQGSRTTLLTLASGSTRPRLFLMVVLMVTRQSWPNRDKPSDRLGNGEIKKQLC